MHIQIEKAYCRVLNCPCGGVTNHCITACVPKYNDAQRSPQQITQSDCNALMQCNALSHIWYQIRSHCLKSSAGCSTYKRYNYTKKKYKNMRWRFWSWLYQPANPFAMFPGTCNQVAPDAQGRLKIAQIAKPRSASNCQKSHGEEIWLRFLATIIDWKLLTLIPSWDNWDSLSTEQRLNVRCNWWTGNQQFPPKRVVW